MKKPVMAKQELIEMAQKVYDEIIKVYSDKTKGLETKVKDLYEASVVHSLIINRFVDTHCRYMETAYGPDTKQTKYHYLKAIDKSIKHYFRTSKS